MKEELSYGVISYISHPFLRDWLSFDDSAVALQESIRSGRPVVSTPILLPGYKGTRGRPTKINNWVDLSVDTGNDQQTGLDSAIGNVSESGEPASSIHYPILAGASDSVIASNYSNGGGAVSQVVGFLSVITHWSEILTNVLAEGSNGTIVVFDNPCSSSFTYVVNGPEAIYLGIGDKHDKTYDAHETTATLVDMASYSFRSYASTWIPLNTEYCQFSIRVYPSHAVEADYVTLYPVLFTLLIFFAFIMELGCFYWYTKTVERRQRSVLFVARKRTNELEEANRRLEDAHREVIQSSALQLRHFACMSHEIRTPLNAIVGTASILSGTALDEGQEEAVGLIVASGELLRAIVDDVLDYAKLESGNVDIDLKEDNLQAILSFVVSAMEAKAGILPNRPSIRTFYDVNLGEVVFTDTLRLRQILINLFSNALKFSKHEGVVEFTVSLGPSSMRHHECSPTRSTEGTSADGSVAAGSRAIRFVMKDYGRGIKRENFQRIFQPFLQEATERAGVNEGTGLGLSITKKLVERLGGTIEVDSVFGEWSKLTVDLPCVPKVDLASSSLPARLNLLANVSVLFVDYDKQVSAQVERTFDHFRVRCMLFSTMLEAWEALKRTESLAGTGSSERFVCFVRLTLFERDLYEQLRAAVPSVVLVTFGAYPVDRAGLKSIRHLAPPSRLLPVVLIREIADACSRSVEDPSMRTAPSTLDESSKGLHTERERDKPIRVKDLRVLVDDDSKANQKERGRVSEPGHDFDSKSSDPLSVKDLRVLVAEDNKINQKVLCRILELLGVTHYEVVENGQQAVEREAAVAFDVVLMDLQMPVMDGIEACRLIHARPGGSDDGVTHPIAQVVFVTASVSVAIREECEGAGGIDFVAKPCNVSMIQACLERIVAMHDV